MNTKLQVQYTDEARLLRTGRFVKKVEAILGKRIERRSRGRPSNMRKDSHEQSVK